MRSRAAHTGGPLSGARGALPVRFAGPEKEPHETPSGLHRHGTGLVRTPYVVRDLVRAAYRPTSTPPSSDSVRSDQQGHPLLHGRPRQRARSRQPKPRATRHPRTWHSAIPFALSRCESSCPSDDERSPNATKSGAYTMTCRYDAASSQPNIQIERPKHHFPMATTGSPTNTVSHMGDSGRPRPSSDSKPRLNNAAARQRSWAEWDRRSATRGTGTGPGLLLTDALPSASTLDGRVRQRKGAYPGEFSRSEEHTSELQSLTNL